MKRIGTIKFYRELEYIFNNSTYHNVKESLLIVIFDYLNHYELSETDLAMKNIKKYFYPEFIHFYESITKYYPQIIQIFNHFYSSIDKDVAINNFKDEIYILANESLFSSFEDNSINELYRLIVNNVNKKSSHEEFVY